MEYNKKNYNILCLLDLEAEKPADATHYCKNQGAFYKRNHNGEWFVFSSVADEPKSWLPSPGTNESCLTSIVNQKQEPVTWNALTDDDRKRALESMPDWLDGFMKKWGWLHFAKAIEDICKEKNASHAQCVGSRK